MDDLIYAFLEIGKRDALGKALDIIERRRAQNSFPGIIT